MIGLTEKNRRWLNEKFSAPELNYFAHEPLWGYHRGNTEGGHILRFCRTLNLLRMLIAMEGRMESLLDVGCGEGYDAALLRQLVPSCKVTVSDLSFSMANKANDLFGLRACVSNAMDIPFADDSFDVVLGSELIEHVSGPFRMISEFVRIARKFVVITTESSILWPLYRWVCLNTRNFSSPHYDRNIWLANDFSVMFGERCSVYPQFRRGVFGLREPDDVQQARRLTYAMSRVHEVSAKTAGIVVVIAKRKDTLPTPQFFKDEKILDIIFEGPVNKCAKEVESWDKEWVDKIVCPECRNRSLRISHSQEITCTSCVRGYGKNNGILDFLPPIVQDRELSDELSAIKSFRVAQNRERRLDRLARAFSEDRAEDKAILYLVCRALRRLLRLIVTVIS